MTGARIEYNVPVGMRDGAVLRADIYRPVGDGPWPVIVARTPYDKLDPYVTMLLDPLLAVRHGLVAVIQDVRGRFASDGQDFVPLRDEALDGADTIAWAAGIEGSSGRVGMWGPSYLGNVQWQAAGQRPAALRAIAPMTTFRTGDGLATRGGARELGLCRPWSVYAGFDLVARQQRDPSSSPARMSALIAAADGLPHATFEELPTGRSTQEDPVLVRLGVPSFDIEAADVSGRQPDVVVPALNIGGWFDVFLQGTIDNFVNGRPEDRLLIGPWNHMSTSPQQGDVNHGCAGAGAAVDLGASVNDLTFDWLGAQLAGEPPADDWRVKIFTMGTNRWRVEDTWPLERAEPVRYHLCEAGLSDTNDPGPTGTRTFRYDPADPVATLGGNTLLDHAPAGTFDQARIEQRHDVVLFTTGPLLVDVEVTGRVTAILLVSADAPTTDWVVRLCDVHPDGGSYNICDGIVRVTSTSGARQSVEVDLWSTSMVFRAGHRIRVQVTASCFPRWDRNLNTSDGFETGRMRVAEQTLHLGSDSYITLPVIPDRPRGHGRERISEDSRNSS